MRKQEIADAHERHRDQHHRTGAVAMKHMADDGTFDGAFGAREGKREGGRGPAKIQLLAERQKENRKAVAVKAGAEQAHRRRGGHHAPAVKKSGELFEHGSMLRLERQQ